MRWLDQVLHVTRESESPRRYFYWSALAAVAAVVKNNVILDRFYYKLSPNIYVMLIGKSGLRKGVPVAFAKNLVEDLQTTRVIVGCNSIQAIIDDLQTAITFDNGGPPLTEAAGFFVASEFGSFLVEDPSALTKLTDLFDTGYHKDWVYRTIRGGKQTLHYPCLTMLGASNEVHFKDAVPENAIGGGFIARTFIVFEELKACVNSLVDKPEQLPTDDLKDYLRDLTKVRGQFAWSVGGKKLYDSWYRDFSKAPIDDNTGTLDRIHDQILKAAMLISLARAPDLTLERDDIEEAIDVCSKTVPGVRKVVLGHGKHQLAPGTAIVLKELIAKPEHEASKTQLLQKYWGNFDTYDLDRIIQSLLDARAIKAEDRQIPGKPPGHKDKWLVLDPKVLENYQKMQSSKEGGEK